jgi:hypothetical protein
VIFGFIPFSNENLFDSSTQANKFACSGAQGENRLLHSQVIFGFISFSNENPFDFSAQANKFACSGAQGENRTLMMLPSIDFESIASTNSATWAIHLFYTKLAPKSIFEKKIIMLK